MKNKLYRAEILTSDGDMKKVTVVAENINQVPRLVYSAIGDVNIFKIEQLYSIDVMEVK